ncbi:hypothetical protein LEMLEM_LOCUS13614 [Lemmus lemmus]
MYHPFPRPMLFPPSATRPPLRSPCRHLPPRGRCKEEVKVAESLHGGLKPRLWKSVAQCFPCVVEHSPAIKVLL